MSALNVVQLVQATIAPNHATLSLRAINIELHCPAAERRTLEVELQRRGCAFASDANIVVMVDVRVTGGHTALSRTNERPIVFVTANPCPEYGLDLCTQRLRPMLFASRDLDEIAQAVRRLHDDPNQPAPTLESPISPRERSVLHGVALGWSDHLIGEGLSIKSAVVRNHVSAVMTKLRAAHPELRLDSRLRLALYYWGYWRWLRR